MKSLKLKVMILFLKHRKKKFCFKLSLNIFLFYCLVMSFSILATYVFSGLNFDSVISMYDVFKESNRWILRLSVAYLLLGLFNKIFSDLKRFNKKEWKEWE